MKELNEELPRSTQASVARNFSSNMAAVRSSSPAPTTRFTSAICCSTTSSLPTAAGPASASRPSPARCATSSRSAGCAPSSTYDREDPKRVYYLSMEFLIGRSLGQQRHESPARSLSRSKLVKEKNLDWLGLLEQEPDAGLGNGGLGRLAACFLDSMATMQLPAMGYGLRYEYGMFKQSIQDGWQHEQPDNWLRRPDPWEVARPHESVEVKLNCSFEMHGGTLAARSRDSRPA